MRFNLVGVFSVRVDSDLHNACRLSLLTQAAGSLYLGRVHREGRLRDLLKTINRKADFTRRHFRVVIRVDLL